MMNDFKLREIRELKGMSREELAKASGIHPQTIMALETGVNNPLNAKLGTLLAICQALGCKVSNLYPNEKNIA